MRPRSAPAWRVIFALVGLITTWCLGCSGYDSLLSSLMGDGVHMSCESQMVAASGPGHANVPSIQSDEGVDCGCQSCVASSPVVWSLRLPHVERPSATAWIAEVPPSITRTPLLPPPQSTI